VDNVTYTLFYGNLNYSDAQAACRGTGLELVSIISAAQAADLSVAFNSYYVAGYGLGLTAGFWVGGMAAPLGSQTWAWADGTPFTYTRWAANENLANDGADCLLATNSNGSWIDDICSTKAPFMCMPPGEQCLL
jgi:hypothetical protein